MEGLASKRLMGGWQSAGGVFLEGEMSVLLPGKWKGKAQPPAFG